MTDLTEKWKAGELGHGAFYVRLFTSAVVVDVFDANLLRFTLYENDIDEVIAPVPSYGEYKAMQEQIAEHRHYCCCSENEVMQLKLAEMEELLKECKNIIAHDCWQEAQFPDGQIVERQDLLTRINNEIQANSVADIKIQESEE